VTQSITDFFWVKCDNCCCFGSFVIGCSAHKLLQFAVHWVYSTCHSGSDASIKRDCQLCQWGTGLGHCLCCVLFLFFWALTTLQPSITH